jgi:site-specific DNA recombinase
MVMRNMQVAIYGRVSSEQQQEAHTIASQVAALRERVGTDGLVLLPDLEFLDDGYSGATLVRPALERLRDRVAAGGVDVLYVHSPDRLARRYALQALLMDEFQQAGVEVIFLNRALGHSPEDDLLLQMQGMFAEYERAKILERSRRGKRHAAQQGAVSVLTCAPYGYRYVRKQDSDGEGRLEVVPEEARVVQQIFTWLAVERATIGQVCRRLTQTGVPTRRGKPAWDRSVVCGMLKNPAYKGAAAFGKTRVGPLEPRLRAQRGHNLHPRRAYSVHDRPASEWISIAVPALVSVEVFEAAQTQLQENQKLARQRERGARYLLQGLVTCAQCGYAYYGKAISHRAAKGHMRDYAYYRCVGTDAYRFGGERVCHNQQVRTDRLDQSVWQEVCGLLADPQRVAREYERRLQPPEGDELGSLQAQTNKLQQGVARLIDSYAEGVIEKGEFEPRVARLRQRIATLEAQTQQLADVAASQADLRLVIGRLDDFAAKVKDGLEEADWLTRREIIRALVKRVEVGQDQVNVVFRVAPDPFVPGPEEGILQHCGRREDPALWGSGERWPIPPIFHIARRQHFPQQLQEPFVLDASTDDRQEPVVVDVIKRTLN